MQKLFFHAILLIVGKECHKERKMAVLGKLLEKISYECVRGTLEREVTDIVYDSRKVTAGCMFVCIPGAKADGHIYAKDAVAAGAAALLVCLLYT